LVSKLGIYGQKTAIGIPPPKKKKNLESPSSETTGRIEKARERCKNGTDILCHLNTDTVAICRSILMRISAFLEEEILFQTFKRHLNYAAMWRRIYLKIRLKFDFFSENSKGKVCAYNFDHLGKG